MLEGLIVAGLDTLTSLVYFMKYVYGVYVQQAWNSGVANLVWGTFFAALVLILYKRVLPRARVLDEESHYNDGAREVVTCIAVFIISVISLILYTHGALELANPEYYALHELMKVMK